ncbi:MAG: hypothetical protein ACRDQF_17710, partial [Thermocrispum sp.]
KLTLSAWLRESGRRRIEEQRQRPLQTAQDVRAFFAALPDEEGVEPDWAEHLQVMEESRGHGRPSA